ncbi:MAG: amidohydrolase family protein [Deinococcales bacterium]
MPRQDAGIVIQSLSSEAGTVKDAHIIAVDSLSELAKRFKDLPSEQAFAISPMPVNAHVHLDLTEMPLFQGGYSNFLQRVTAFVRAQKGPAIAAVKQGLAEMAASGIKVFGDIVRYKEVMYYLLEEASYQGFQGVAYWEVIAPRAEDADRVFAETVALIEEFKSFERANGIRVGLSPHTPHTVSAELLKKLARFAQIKKIPMQIHLAESPEEVLFHREGRGPLRDMLTSVLSVSDWQPSGLSPLKYLASLGVLEAAPTLVHMVQVDEDDIRLLAKSDAVVIHCPRSNQNLECGRFPWELYMRYGVEVALGTDSRGSSPTLNLKDEVMAAIDLHGDKLNPLSLIRSSVKGGYKALALPIPRFQRGDSAEKFYIW